MSDAILVELAETIRARRDADAGKSYTRQLLEGGPQIIAKKLGEEAVETIIAALNEDRDALKDESADLLYHLLVLLESRDVNIEDVFTVLKTRMGLSGLEEKASRQSPS